MTHAAGVLAAVHSTLPAPPAAVLAHLDLNSVLDAPYGSQTVDLEALKQAVQEDADADVHSQLYHMLNQSEADTAEWQSDGEAMMQESGHSAVVHSLEPAHFDLCYNFHRYDSWEKVLSELPSLAVCLRMLQ